MSFSHIVLSDKQGIITLSWPVSVIYDSHYRKKEDKEKEKEI